MSLLCTVINIDEIKKRAQGMNYGLLDWRI